MTMLAQFWFQHSPIFSILIPAFTAFLLLIIGNPGTDQLLKDWRQPWRRAISITSALLGLIVAISHVHFASQGHIQVYQLSEWAAPFGIVLVLDRLSAFMLLLTHLLAVPLLWYASKDWDLRGRYFHALVQFLLMGLNGAFLTGDLFNLFVFFEILLMASYVLLIYGQGKGRFQLGIHYVTINLLASALFLIGLGLIYASVGSLNMADVTRLMPTLAPDQKQMAIAGSYLLFTVFAIKAAVIPLGFWLPKTYAVAATPVAALFTIMTKVGIYAILRVNSIIFYVEAEHLLFQILLLLGIAGSLYGVIGALAAVRLRRFVGFMILSSLGTICIAIGLHQPQSWSAALYYLLHSTLIGAAFYLFCGWITAQRGEFKDHLKIAPKMKQDKLLSILFFVMAMMMAGLPPLSGFIGKVLILQASLNHAHSIWIIISVLTVSLLSLLAFVRVGFILFWQAEQPSERPESEAYQHYQALPHRAPSRNDRAIYSLLACLIIYVVAAAPITHYFDETAQQLSKQQDYQKHILKTDHNGKFISVQPFDNEYVPETKYSGENLDSNAHYIPDVIAPKTLEGEHISEFKKRQIHEQQTQVEDGSLNDKAPDNSLKLKPMEGY
ncbi:MAG: monovalent cation/H+ antiporter subunit D [Acinetobacter sp.]